MKEWLEAALADYRRQLEEAESRLSQAIRVRDKCEGAVIGVEELLAQLPADPEGD